MYPLIPVCGAIAIDSLQKVMDIICSQILIRSLDKLRKMSSFWIWDYRRTVTRVGLMAILISSLMGCSRVLALHYGKFSIFRNRAYITECQCKCRHVFTYTGFRAPFDLYFQLHRETASGEHPYLSADKNLTLCYGKEWHRFPTHFLVPSMKWDVRFIKSEFQGQLPGLFPPYDPEGTKRIPDHMNDDNAEEISRYVSRFPEYLSTASSTDIP